MRVCVTGILLYNRYLSAWAYRKIFACTMVFLAVMNLTDVVLVKRWNLAVGVPDEVLVLGDCALSPMARRFYIMPLYILAAKVCPSGAEATVFAILTALGNFGTSISVYFGSLVLQYFDIRDGNYDNLVLVIVLKCASRLLPLLLIPLLVPRGAPFEAATATATATDRPASGGGGGCELQARRGAGGQKSRGGYQEVLDEEDSCHGVPGDLLTTTSSTSSSSSNKNNNTTTTTTSSSSSSGGLNRRSSAAHTGTGTGTAGRAVDQVVIGTGDSRI
jgi:hypothetical protein